jgi:murein L,D-transpeptidase YcbB/YkuD
MTVDPGLVDWNQATWSDVNNMRMVQGSGSANPLGLVRVIMENPYNIYLHDTPSKSYFKRTDRALSSGCIRMSEPQKLADFVLSHNNGWSEDRKNQILANGRQTDIRADEPLPVYILYQTVWLGDNGQIVYGHDIYGHDAKLLKELKNINGVAIPAMDSGVKTAKSSINS